MRFCVGTQTGASSYICDNMWFTIDPGDALANEVKLNHALTSAVLLSRLGASSGIRRDARVSISHGGDVVSGSDSTYARYYPCYMTISIYGLSTSSNGYFYKYTASSSTVRFSFSLSTTYRLNYYNRNQIFYLQHSFSCTTSSNGRLYCYNGSVKLPYYASVYIYAYSSLQPLQITSVQDAGNWNRYISVYNPNGMGVTFYYTPYKTNGYSITGGAARIAYPSWNGNYFNLSSKYVGPLSTVNSIWIGDRGDYDDAYIALAYTVKVGGAAGGKSHFYTFYNVISEGYGSVNYITSGMVYASGQATTKHILAENE